MGMVKAVRSVIDPTGAPKLTHKLNGKSRTLYGFDPVVLSSHSGVISASSGPAIRHLAAADVSASYQEGGANAGVFGFLASEGGTVDSSGIMGTRPVPSSKLSTKEPNFMMPTYAFGLTPDPNTGYTLVPVYYAIPGIQFKCKLGGGGTLVGSNALIGTKAGIDISGTTFTLDTSETVKPLNIVDWDPNDTTYVWAEVDVDYCQYLTGVNYTTQ